VVKLLDFGLAKAAEEPAAALDPSDSPTQTISATRAGVILGTAAYMSPEQARGAPLDKRADIWAFGVVLYEMLTGRHLFRGETVSDTLAGVLKTDPDWSELPAETPPTIRRLLQRCLERDRNRRLHDIADARIEIDDAQAQPEAPAVTAAPKPVPRLFRWIAAAPEDRRGATPRALPIEFVELNPPQGFGKAIALWELNRLLVLKLYMVSARIPGTHAGAEVSIVIPASKTLSPSSYPRKRL
jgi:serine/threonine protein kinase